MSAKAAGDRLSPGQCMALAEELFEALDPDNVGSVSVPAHLWPLLGRHAPGKAGQCGGNQALMWAQWQELMKELHSLTGPRYFAHNIVGAMKLVQDESGAEPLHVEDGPSLQSSTEDVIIPTSDIYPGEPSSDVIGTDLVSMAEDDMAPSQLPLPPAQQQRTGPASEELQYQQTHGEEPCGWSQPEQRLQQDHHPVQQDWQQQEWQSQDHHHRLQQEWQLAEERHQGKQQEWQPAEEQQPQEQNHHVGQQQEWQSEEKHYGQQEQPMEWQPQQQQRVQTDWQPQIPQEWQQSNVWNPKESLSQQQNQHQGLHQEWRIAEEQHQGKQQEWQLAEEQHEGPQQQEWHPQEQHHGVHQQGWQSEEQHYERQQQAMEWQPQQHLQQHVQTDWQPCPPQEWQQSDEWTPEKQDAQQQQGWQAQEQHHALLQEWRPQQQLQYPPQSELQQQQMQSELQQWQRHEEWQPEQNLDMQHKQWEPQQQEQQEQHQGHRQARQHSGNARQNIQMAAQSAKGKLMRPKRMSSSLPMIFEEGLEGFHSSESAVTNEPAEGVGGPCPPAASGPIQPCTSDSHSSFDQGSLQMQGAVSPAEEGKEQWTSEVQLASWLPSQNLARVQPEQTAEAWSPAAASIESHVQPPQTGQDGSAWAHDLQHSQPPPPGQPPPYLNFGGEQVEQHLAWAPQLNPLLVEFKGAAHAQPFALRLPLDVTAESRSLDLQHLIPVVADGPSRDRFTPRLQRFIPADPAGGSDRGLPLTRERELTPRLTKFLPQSDQLLAGKQGFESWPRPVRPYA